MTAITRYLGIGFSSTWNQPVAPVKYFEVLSETFKMEREKIKVKTIRSDVTRKIVEDFNIVRGTAEFVLNYQDFPFLAYCILGSVDTSGGGPYSHTSPASTGIAARPALTVDLQRDSAALTWRYYGLTMTTLALTAQKGQEARATAGFVGAAEYLPGALSGAHDAATHATILTDSGESWTVDGLIGWTVNNTTDGSSGTITDNTATTITVSALAGGSDNQWEAADTYTVTPPSATYPDLDVAIPSEISVSFDGTALDASALNLNLNYPVDEPYVLRSTTLGKQPRQNDVLEVAGDVSVIFEDATQFNKSVTGADIDVQILMDSGGDETLTINMDKTKLMQGTPNLTARERLNSVYTIESYFNTTATANIQFVGTNDDAVITT